MMLRQATRAPGLANPEETRTVYVAGPAPDRLTEARERVMSAVRSSPNLTAAELAREAEVSAGVVKGLHESGALIAQEVAKDRAPPRLDPEHTTRTLNPEQEIAAEAIRNATRAQKYPRARRNMKRCCSTALRDRARLKPIWRPSRTLSAAVAKP